MFSLSELLFIGALALLVIGPKQLPEVARNIARFLNELKRISNSVVTEFKETQTRVRDEAQNIKSDIQKPTVKDEKPS